MNWTEESLVYLARGIRCDNAEEMIRRRATVEASLETLVRCALRDGTGDPHLVDWVNETLPMITAGRRSAVPERAAPVLARILCRTLINLNRTNSAAPVAASRETVVGV